jgi:proteasome lid subunit RPN8/RPN11
VLHVYGCVTRLVLDRSLVLELKARATESFPQEACGLLLGSLVGTEVVVGRYYACRNIATCNREYAIDPDDHAAAELLLHEGTEIVGDYHSHHGSATPSVADEHNVRAHGRIGLLLGNPTTCDPLGLRAFVVALDDRIAELDICLAPA